jgi:hypothetical protein
MPRRNAQVKYPAFWFYPGDWMKDTDLRAVSTAARGLWIDCLCLMWESDKRGYLVLTSGKTATTEQLARMTGNTPECVAELVKELEECGVASRTDEGVLFSRRMVRDESKRRKCSKAGKKGGGNPHLKTFKGSAKGHVKGESKGTPKRITEDEYEIETSMSEGRRGGFKRPSIEDVQVYVSERGNKISAQKFVDYYEARGWKLNGKSMKDWKACVRTWEGNQSERTNGNRRNTSLRHPDDAEADWIVRDDTGAA